MVIGAGYFPSFRPFLDIILNKFPNIDEINFTLIEPHKTETDLFMIFLWSEENNKIHEKINIDIHNIDIKEYLEKITDTAFNIIYFEHPDLFPLSIVLAKVNAKSSLLEVSLRESIPLLKKVIDSQSIIIASCLLKHDLTQLNSLINFSLNLRTKIVSLSRFFPHNVPYGLGLISIVNKENLPNTSPETISKAIKRQDMILCVFITISFLIFFLTISWAKPISFFFTLGLVLYHRYGIWGFITKLILITAQILLLIFTIK